MSGTSSPVSSSGEGILGAFSRLALRRSNQALVVSPGRMASVGDVDSISIALSDQSSALGAQCGALVGLSAGSGPAFLAGLLALQRAGAAALLLDSTHRRKIVAALTSLGASAVLECVHAWPASASDFHFTRVAVTDLTPLRVSVVKLTSGSTGVPRGVAMRTEHMLADEAALARTMELRADDRLLAAIPLSHSYGFTTLALSALVRGITLVLPADRGPFSPLAAARDLGATVFPTVPAYMQALLKPAPPPAWPDSIRLVISAAPSCRVPPRRSSDRPTVSRCTCSMAPANAAASAMTGKAAPPSEAPLANRWTASDSRSSRSRSARRAKAS